MKFLIISLLMFSLSAGAAGNEEKSKDKVQKQEANTSIYEDSVYRGGVDASEMNPSPNPVPRSEEEVLDNSMTIQNMEIHEDSMDYSTTPETRPEEPSED